MRNRGRQPCLQDGSWQLVDLLQLKEATLQDDKSTMIVGFSATTCTVAAIRSTSPFSKSPLWLLSPTTSQP